MAENDHLQEAEALVGARVDSKVSALIDEIALRIAEDARRDGCSPSEIEDLVKAFRSRATEAGKDALTAVLMNGVRRAKIAVGV